MIRSRHSGRPECANSGHSVAACEQAKSTESVVQPGQTKTEFFGASPGKCYFVFFRSPPCVTRPPRTSWTSPLG
jgi:hypothetical protein